MRQSVILLVLFTLYFLCTVRGGYLYSTVVSVGNSSWDVLNDDFTTTEIKFLVMDMDRKNSSESKRLRKSFVQQNLVGRVKNSNRRPIY